MITTLFLSFFDTLYTGIYYLLPSSDGFPPEVLEAIHWLGGFVYVFDFMIATDVLITVLGYIVGFEVGVFGWRVSKQFIGFVRGTKL